MGSRIGRAQTAARLQYWEAEGKNVAGNEIVDFQQVLDDSQESVKQLEQSHYAVDATFSLMWKVRVGKRTYFCAAIKFENKNILSVSARTRLSGWWAIGGSGTS